MNLKENVASDIKLTKETLQHMIKSLHSLPQENPSLIVPYSMAGNLMACEARVENTFNKYLRVIERMTQVLNENCTYDPCGFDPEAETKETLVDMFKNNDQVARKCLKIVEAILK
jgi:aspartate/tyrosine/aromatic aminotransferase